MSKRHYSRWIVSLLIALVATATWEASELRAQTRPAAITVSPQNPVVGLSQTQQFTVSSSSSLQLGEARMVAGGAGHTCALLSDGTVKCWGINTSGQLGNGTTISSSTGVSVSGLSGVMAIAAGGNHTCALLADGTLECWGANGFGELGDGTTTNQPAPVAVIGLGGGVTAITAGPEHTCAVLSGGTVRCWGWNVGRMLGDNSSADHSSIPVTVTGLTGATALAGGVYHTCALLADGTAKCWGDNTRGSLGDGTGVSSHSPVAVSGLTGATAIASGFFHTCALLSDGTAKCWGQNQYGEIGDNSIAMRLAPVAVAGLTQTMAISAGDGFTCGLMPDGTGKCWGYNTNGQLGDGTTTERLTPVGVTGLDGAWTMSSGTGHTCAVLSGGSTKCWGWNNNGQLGDGTLADSPSPIAVTGDSTLPNIGVRQVSAGAFHTCALLSDGTVRCWGGNDHGQLSNGTLADSGTPAVVGGVNGATEIAAGYFHTCALHATGTAKCWGDNSYGELGYGTTAAQPTPVVVNGLSGATALSSGNGHTCALIFDGTVKCWGFNAYGQLGNGSLDDSSSAVQVSGLSDVTAISAGYSYTCALLSDGSVKCWGEGDAGELGNGSIANSAIPVAVSGISGATMISAGGGHTCALIYDGTARCWGFNHAGQLGNGNQTFSSIPVAVVGLSGIRFLTTGGGHTCAVLSDGTARCWGNNTSGQIGTGFPSLPQLTPVAVIDLNGTIAAAAGTLHTCALISSGTVKCWGPKINGQLGDGKVENNSGPPAPTLPLVPSPLWSSSNNVVSINVSSGLATALAYGGATITAAYGAVNAHTTLTVPAPPPVLSGSTDSAKTAVNLTTEGGLDWVHWGDAALNRKAGVAPQLSNYTAVGGALVQSYSNDPRPLSWTDGAPTANSANNLKGVYISGVGKGFSLTVPADASTRTLILHVGGWNSGGTLTAHLSNGTQPDYVNATPNASGSYDRNYTLTYSAGAAGQTLSVTWKMNTGSGNVTLNGAALNSAGPVIVPHISATAGTPQSTTINTTFANFLQATVKDSSNNPISGAVVTFTALGSGASGTFAGSATVTVNTDINGIATAPAFKANSTAGGYPVVASTPGEAVTASFSLTNQVGSPASITATGGASQSTTINTSFPALMVATVKDSGGNLVSGATVTFTAPGSGASGTFTGGSPTASAATIGNGTVTAPAFSANGTTGGYSVTASVTGIATSASFSLTNNPVAVSGSLSGLGDSAKTAVDLAAEGTLDWVHFGDASLNRKSTGGSQISTYTVVGGGSATKYSDDPRPMSWTGGNPTANGTNNRDGLYVSGTGKGFSITAPADATTRTLVVHVGGWNSGGTLTAHLSDGSSTDFVNTTSNVSGQYDRNYTLTYNAGAASTNLTVTWKMASGSGNVTVSGAALH